MKLCIVFVCVLQFSVLAKGLAQEQMVDLELKDATYFELFDEIHRQTGLSFIYNTNQLEGMDKINVSASRKSVKSVLDYVFDGTPFTFSFNQNVVMVMKKATPDDEKTSITVQGFVYDEKRQPMPGVTVQVVGTSVGTASTAGGWFSIDLPLMEGKLKFSFVGYKDKEVAFTAESARDTLRVYMEENVEELDEAIVVAYGETTKRKATGSISVVKAEEFQGIPSPSIASLLQGRVAGMDVTQMSGAPGGGGTAVVIRGYNSLDVEQNRRFSNPLWVVDGVPLNSFTSPVTGTNLLADINPDMIESIQVLKDASSAAIYGSRAANGVIIITTKKGRKNQDATFSLNISQTWSILPRLHPVTIGRVERLMRLDATAKTYTAYLDVNDMRWKYPTSLKEVYEHQESSMDGNWIPNPMGDVSNGSFYQDSLNSFYNNATNYFPIYYETGKVTNANIQTYGGSERMSYGIGLGYYDEAGILKGTGFNRIDMNLNLNATPVDRLNVDMRLNGSLTNRKRGQKDGYLDSGYPIETVPGDPLILSTLMPGEGSEPWDYVLEKLSATKEKNRTVRGRANFKLAYEIIDGLSLSASLAADYSIARRNYFEPSTLSYEGYSKSLGETAVNLMVLNENILTYQTTIEENHNLNVVAGFSYQYDQMEYNGGYAMNSPTDKIYYAPEGLPDYTIEDNYGSQTIIPFKHYQSDMQEKTLISYFARLEYNYKQKYLFSLSFRRDGSSTFGEDHRWGTFPSVAAAWTFSEEPFVKNNLGWLSFGKFRASWGRSGMHFDYPYLALGTLGNGFPFEGNSTITPNEVGLYNENLSWEETDQYDFGVDFDFFNYRLGITFDYYYRYTDKLLMQVNIPSPNLFDTQWRNAAAISNEGIELLVKYEIFRTPELYWKLALNWTKNWNRFEKSYDGYDVGRWVIGKPLNGIYAMQTDGFVDEQDELPIFYNSVGWSNYMDNGSGNYYYKPGDLKYIDVNGDASANEVGDNVYIGSALPTASGGLVSEFQWKDFDVNFSMAYQIGIHIVNKVPFSSFLDGPFLINLKKISFWEKPGDNADYASWEKSNNVFHFGSSADKYVEKVNWMKLKTLTIGYSLPQKWMKKIRMTQIRFFVSGENLFTISNYSGLDPETVDITSGQDDGTNYPLARRFTIGLTLKL